MSDIGSRLMLQWRSRFQPLSIHAFEPIPYRLLPLVVIELKKPGVLARAAHVYTEDQLIEQPAIGLFA